MYIIICRLSENEFTLIQNTFTHQTCLNMRCFRGLRGFFIGEVMNKAILTGCLLGDGCLAKGKNSVNAYFCYRSKSKQHVSFVHRNFKQHCTKNYQEIKQEATYDERTDKIYVSYYFRTKCLPTFTQQYEEFYPYKIKIVPKNLIINSACLLFWYIGDGQLDATWGQIRLHTDNFLKQEVEVLCHKLSMFDARPQLKNKQKEQYAVWIPRKKVNKFLQHIGTCPFEDYAHKWQQVPYKNTNIEKNGVRDHSKELQQILESGEYEIYTPYRLWKMYSVPIKCIKNFLIKQNLDWVKKK